jgi:hypothetical protein
MCLCLYGIHFLCYGNGGQFLVLSLVDVSTVFKKKHSWCFYLPLCLYGNGRYSTGGTLPTVTEIRRPVVTAQGEGEEEDEEDEAVSYIIFIIFQYII